MSAAFVCANDPFVPESLVCPLNGLEMEETWPILQSRFFFLDSYGWAVLLRYIGMASSALLVYDYVLCLQKGAHFH